MPLPESVHTCIRKRVIICNPPSETLLLLLNSARGASEMQEEGGSVAPAKQVAEGATKVEGSRAREISTTREDTVQ